MRKILKNTRVNIILFYSLFLLGISSLLAVDSLSLTTTNIDDNIVSGTSVTTINSTNASGTVVYSLSCTTPGIDDSTFSIGGAGNELIINENPDYWTKSSYDICIRATDDEGIFDQNFTLNVIDKTLPEFSSLAVSSNNTSSGVFAKAGDLITFDFDLLTPDSWGTGNNIVFDIGSTVGEILNLDQSLTSLLSLSKTYTVLSGQSGSIDITGYTFVDNNSNSLNGLTIPYTLPQNIIIDTTSPNVSFVDDVSGTPTLSDDINITISDDYLDSLNSLNYAYSFDSTCDGIDNYDQAFTSGLTFSINDTLNNGKYICVKAIDYAGNTTYLASANPLDIATPSIILSGTGINENTSTGTSIGDFTTTFSTGTTFTYSLVAGSGSDDNASFSISGTTIITDITPDFETKNSYNILVRSTDENLNIIETNFVINVTDINETPTDISLNPVSIDENLGTGTTVGTFSTTDEDLGDTFTYSLVAGSGSDDNAIFSISGTTLVADFNGDFEIKSTYSILIRSTDLLGLTVEKQFTIYVNNLAEAPSNVILSGSTVVENSTLGTFVGDFSSIDEDFLDSHNYSLVTGTGDDDNSLFSITGTGLYVNGTIDFETKSTLSILVRSTDLGGANLEKQFSITVINANDTPTDITLSGSTIDENLGTGTTVGIFTTTDEDVGDTFSYTLVAGTGSDDNANFSVSGSTVVAEFTADYETKSSYSIRVQTTDSLGATFEKAINITINNINETPSNLSLSANTLDENLSIGTVVGTFTTTDEDVGDTFTYSLVVGTGSDDNASFSVSGSNLVAEFSADFETKNTYTILVQSTDAGLLTTEKQFTITINDINLAPSSLTLSGSTINENLGAGIVIGELTGTDDGENNGTLTYSINCDTLGLDDVSFSLSGTILSIENPANYETKNSYDVCVRVSDGMLNLDQNFTINVNDINETPTDIALTLTSINENLPVGTLVGTLSTTDEDIGDIFTYSLIAGTGSDDNASFSISGSLLYADFSADYEIKNSYTILVQTTDAGGLTRIEQFTITINDINVAPTDLTLSGSTILENTFMGTLVGTLTGTDDGEDNGTLTYTILCGTGGTDDSKFSIVGNELRTATAINFESGSTLEVCVRVSDGLLNLDKNFVIDVTNVNESPYSFILTQNTFNENVGTGFVVGDLSSLDEDIGDSHTYTFGTGPGSTDNFNFTLSGSQVIASFDPNFESKNLYEVKFAVTDNGGITTDLQSTIIVSDLNESPTDISLTGSTIDENIGTGVLVGIFGTTDEDIGDSHTYTLVGGVGSSDNGEFSLVGDALITNFVGDYETKNVYTIRIRSTDSGGLFTEKQFTINIADVDETGIVVTLSGSTLTENMSTGTLVGDFNTTSSNTGATSFTYTLVAGTGSDDNVSFILSGSTLIADYSADYETKNTYSILVRSTDNLGNSTDKQFTINILNQNEDPLDISLSSNTIDENTMGIYTVGNFSTTDIDLSDSYIYNLVGGVGSNDNALFAIVGNTLVGSFVPDYETKNTYYIRVRSTDAGGLSTEKQFTILINDIGENPTDITFSGSLSLNENIGTGATLGDFDTVGTNSGVTYTYSLTGGVMDNDSFSLSGNTLIAEFSADYEAKNTYNLFVRSTDSLGYFIEENFTVTINNVNEAPSDISLSSNTLDENQTVGSIVGNLSTSDVDVGDNYTYSLVAGTGSDDNAIFTISGSTLVSNFVADYETKNTYSVLLQSTDLGGLTTIKQFTITINNLNTAPSSLTLSGSTIDENLAIGTMIGTLTGIDDGENNGNLNYSFTCATGGLDDTAFSLSGANLLSNAVFNFETKSVYDICVRANDGALDLDQNFIITINDLVENPTDITLSGSLSLIEGIASGYTMGYFSTVGVNTGVTYTYSLVTGTGSDDNSSFTLTGSTLSTDFVADYETKNSYNIRVRSTDSLSGTIEKQFTITITDLNETPTNIQVSNSSLNENLGVGTTIGSFTTIDIDAGSTHTYTLVSGTGSDNNALFSIAGNNLVANFSADYETKNTYTLRVRSTDNGTLFTEKQFTISINDVREGSSGGSSGGGGGGGTLPALQKDVCPSGDYSPSYYDKKCGTKPTFTGSTSTGTTIVSTSTGSTFPTITGSGNIASTEKIIDKLFTPLTLVSADNKKYILYKTTTGKFILKNQDGLYINKLYTTLLQAKLYVSNIGDNEREVIQEMDDEEIVIDLGFDPIIYKNSKGERFIAQKTTDGRYVLYTEDGIKLNGYFTKLWHIILYLKYI